jgi:hypothetical protein
VPLSPAPADAAKAFHESLYRQKLASLVEKKKLTDEDDKALRDMQVGLSLVTLQEVRRRLEIWAVLVEWLTVGKAGPWHACAAELEQPARLDTNGRALAGVDVRCGC